MFDVESKGFYFFVAVGLHVLGLGPSDAFAETLVVGVAQPVIEDTLDKNQSKMLKFINEAKGRGCQLLVFPENALYWPDIAVDSPSRAHIRRAVDVIAAHADRSDLYVAFGTADKSSDQATYRNRAFVFDPEGRRVLSYWKTKDVPSAFDVDGVRCSLVICSDRTFLEYSDLPCLVDDAKVILDISGGHGGDDGRPEMRWIRYRPWATRTNAYLVVSNSIQNGTDFMGNSPWGGGSAIVQPNGTVQAYRTYENDVLIVEEIDTLLATRREAEARRHHPLFSHFWERGAKLLRGETGEPVAHTEPQISTERDIKIAAAQMACSRDLHVNVERIVQLIAWAGRKRADVVVFPELAVTGYREEDILAAADSALVEALERIRAQARASAVYVVVGMPARIDGARRNAAMVIDDQGEVVTGYGQVVCRRDTLFVPGKSTQAMWFTLKGVQAIVTIGDDADRIEIADLAASRGMYLHFHMSYQADASTEERTLRRQRDLLMLRYARFGALVNAADPRDLVNPSSPAHGGSMIVSREGGHEQAAPEGVAYYLPYQTSIIESGGDEACTIEATRRTTRHNDLDLARHHRNRARRHRPESGWVDWIAVGANATAK